MKRSATRRLLACLLVLTMVLTCLPLGVLRTQAVSQTPDAAQPLVYTPHEDGTFEIWFNTDGATGITAGQQGDAPVFAGEDMGSKGTSNKISYNGTDYYMVQGKNNPKMADGSNPNGKIPEKGAYMTVEIPVDGTLTFYGLNGSGKPLYVVTKAADGSTSSVSESGTGVAGTYTVGVTAGETVCFYAQGSKLQFAGFVLEPPKAEAEIPLELLGLPLGEAKITFSNGVTDDVTVGDGDTTVKLTTGYVYAVSVDSANLLLDIETVDLTGALPEKITITVSEAPKHLVSGSFKGIPAGATVTDVTFTDEAGAATTATVTGDTYTVELKNGKYTTAAVCSDTTYEVFDHVAVEGTEGEEITNDVWFYGPATTYPTEYKEVLKVGKGEGCDYATINEAVAAAAAMTRDEGVYVTLELQDEEYFEQVVIKTPYIKMVAAAGVTPTVSWYYGIGYKYYSVDGGYYSEKHANDKFSKGYAARWGAVVNTKGTAVGFLAEGITFSNTFNQYVTAAEIADGVELGDTAEYGQSFNGAMIDRTSTDLVVSDLTNVERAAAFATEGDNAEFYNCTFVSSQDTLFTGSKTHSYFRNCTIVGQTDYIFGEVDCKAVFDDCELVWCGYSGEKSKAGYVTATKGAYLFRNCHISGKPENTVTPGYFGRPWSTAAEVYFIGTAIEPDMMSEDGWYKMNGTPEDATYREFGNYIVNPADPADKTNFYYTNYAKSNLTFCLTYATALDMVEPKNDTTFLGTWEPVHHVKTAVDLDAFEHWYLGKEEKVWKFKFFGTSTNSTANTIGEGSNITDGVKLNSCTSKADGSINKKGGKFVSDAPADGMSLYYTTIDPTTENFVLQADVTIDYMNPTPDGQEGFAVLIRDSLNGSGSFYSNMMSVGGTKLPYNGAEVKDAVGLRAYTGITDPEDVNKNNVRRYREAFTADKIEQGKTYRVRLEKTSYGYLISWLNLETNEVIGAYTLYIGATDPYKETVSSYAELSDPMAVQEPTKAYIGFAVARGINATFANIQFETSDWKAEDWKPQPTTYVDPVYTVNSADTWADDTYTLTFKANADCTVDVKAGGETLTSGMAIEKDKLYSVEYPITGTTTYEITFTPNPDFRFGPFEKLSSYEPVTVTKVVTVRKFAGDIIYVTPEGVSTNGGTSFEDAVDVRTALSFAAAGQTVLLKGTVYDLSGKALLVQRGRNGTAEAPITVTTEEGYAEFNFGDAPLGTSAAIAVWGNYWHFSNINVTRTPEGSKGMQVAGDYNVVENMNFYNNGSTGMQISGTSAETFEFWPANNLVRNCTAINNADKALEDADGFAAKITVGEGNVFEGCIAAYNADDGWDLFAKADTGSIGTVTIKDCLTYRNGYLLVSSESTIPDASLVTYWDCEGATTTANGTEPLNIVWPELRLDETGTLVLVGTIGKDVRVVAAGNGNGFKMGGTNLPGGHTLVNSIAYENKAKGFDSNSCPDIKIINSTSYNNKNYNVAMYTNNKSATTGYEATGLLSFRTPDDYFTAVNENLKLQGQEETAVKGVTNFYWTDGSSVNTEGTAVSADWFYTLDTSIVPTRRADGTIDMHGLLQLTEKGLEAKAGAAGSTWAWQNPFKDVSTGVWYYDDVKEGTLRGLFKGITEDEFRPEMHTTRAMVVTLLYRLAGEPEVEYAETFPDVKEGAYYTKAVVWATKLGITNGYTDGTFRPTEDVTRSEMVTFLCRYASIVDGQSMEGVDTSILGTFPDSDQVPNYALESMAWAVQEQIIFGEKNGDVVSLNPRGLARRAEMASVLCRYIRSK